MRGVKMPKLEKYGKAFELGFQTALEYRINFLLSLLSAAYPIFIQSFLWTAIYGSSSSGVVYGYTYRQIMIYTFLAGLVSRIVRTGFEYDIMQDIKMGKFSTFLVQPIHYFPYRLCSYLGQKLPGLGMILTIMAILLLGLNLWWGFALEALRIAVFLVTLMVATVLNFIIFYCFSAIAFWIVEVGFLFEGIRIVTILLSGGIFPVEVFGERALRVIDLLPFKYTVSYPINVLNGRLTLAEAGNGLLIQAAWILASLLAARVLWQVGNKRYVAIGG